MGLYKITFKASAEKDLRKLPKSVIVAVLAVIDGLAVNPYPVGIKKLKGMDKSYFRVRSGDYRIIYEVHNQQLIVQIVEIGHRKEVYKS
jgi:mRNA interferase RelE/StbE